MYASQRLPRVTGEGLVQALQKAGFEIARRKGSHVQLCKVVEGRKITFPVPVHKGKTLKPGNLKGILRLAGLSVADLEKLLRR